ncbi:MAG: hypothetical protein GY835_10635 [bacterium]|nr:hypothetical protein [bacterium]
MPELITNSLGRLVPGEVNGFPYQAYCGAFADLPAGTKCTIPEAMRQGRGDSKIMKSLADVIEISVPDNGWISLPHYYREDPTPLILTIDALRKAGRRGIKIMGIAFFSNHAEVLLPAIQEGILAGFEGNTYGKMAQAVAAGDLAPWVALGRTHGGRARAFQRGEREIDLAIGPVPIADAWGNANGVMGNPRAQCGPIRIFEPDTWWAKRTVLLTEEIYPGLLMPNPIDMQWVDWVVKVDRIGDNRNISTGTTDITRVKGDPQREQIAANVMGAMEAAGVIKNGFNFQIGAGAGLLVLRHLFDKMRKEGIRSGFTVGGSMDYHVDLIRDNLVENFLDGQCFQPSPRLFESLRNNPRHREISTMFYYSPSVRQPAVGLMDVVVLGANEVDRNFNVNTMTGFDGKLRSGVGGGPDASAGAKLSLFAMPLARVNRAGMSAPCVRDTVNTVVTPGEVVSAIITEECIAINDDSSSPYLPELRENAERFGLEIVNMDDMVERSAAKAHEIGTIMELPRWQDEIVLAVEWRDGRLIDVVRKLDN